MAAETSAAVDEAHEPIESSPAFEVSKVDEHERRLGRYELVYEIGHGGMANVFLARAHGPRGSRSGSRSSASTTSSRRTGTS